MGTTDAPSQTCPACGELSPASARFCMHCAQPFSPQCPSCGKDVPAIARFCPHCAHALNPSGAEVSGHVSGPLPSGAMAAPTQQSAGLPSAAEASRQASMEGETLLKANHPEQALAAFERAIQLDASNARAYAGKGDALSRWKRHEEALAVFDQAIARDPSYAAAYGNKGVSLFHLQRYEEALRCFDLGIQRDPNDAVIYNNKGTVLRTMQRYGEALLAFNQAIQLDSKSVSAHNGKGHVLRALGRYEEAQASFDWANRLKAGVNGPVAQPVTAMPGSSWQRNSSALTPARGASFNPSQSKGSVLALIGGGLCVLAFFLPLTSSQFLNVSLASLSSYTILAWIEPLVGVCFMFFAWRAGTMGREAHTINIVLGVEGVLFFLYILFAASSIISGAGIGFWAAALGMALGLAGGIQGRAETT